MRVSNGAVVAATIGLVLIGSGLLPITQAEAQQRVRHPARIRVHPLNYPGPNAVRQCQFWLAQEARPSGTVIVPREHCWWERG